MDGRETISLERLLEAVNSLDEPTRRRVAAALAERDRQTYYFSDPTGRVSAEKVR